MLHGETQLDRVFEGTDPTLGPHRHRWQRGRDSWRGEHFVQPLLPMTLRKMGQTQVDCSRTPAHSCVQEETLETTCLWLLRLVGGGEGKRIQKEAREKVRSF